MTEALLDRAQSEKPINNAVVVPHPAAPSVQGPFRACVHRGTRQIGGTCVELECAGARLLLDLGLPLDADPAGDPVPLLPDVSGLRAPDPGLLALVVSHGHADHWGLAQSACLSLRAVMGAATRRILLAAAPFVPRPVPFAAQGAGRPNLADRVPLHIGPFTITPYLMDHSAFDAYALLVEAGGRRLFYSGDLRAHGRKAGLFERLLRDPPRPVHAMLMEGSSLGRLEPGQRFPTEAEVEALLVERLRAPGFVAVCASAQNIDRVVSLYRACKRTGRTLVLDLYAAEVLAATGNPNIPRAGWPNVAIYVPQYQRRHVARTERFDLLESYKAHRIFPQRLAALAPRAAMLFRSAMLPDVDALGTAWTGARAIWSQWDGYLRGGTGALLKAALATRSVPLEVTIPLGTRASPTCDASWQRSPPTRWSRCIPLRATGLPPCSARTWSGVRMVNGGKFDGDEIRAPAGQQRAKNQSRAGVSSRHAVLVAGRAEREVPEQEQR